MVKEKKSHFTARIPEYLIDKINTEAKTRNTTVTAIVEEAFKLYFSENLPGLCPSCRTQNDPHAQYCQSCGEPLTEEAEKNVAAVTRLVLEPSFIRALFEKAGINQMEERNDLGIAINTIYRLQSQIDELQPVVDWAKKKMEEEGKEY